jgi:hypothetical protein
MSISDGIYSGLSLLESQGTKTTMGHLVKSQGPQLSRRP